LLSVILKQGSAIIIGGDGRADSPGHSAKFGSYGILELNTNKVLHIELVQVLSKAVFLIAIKERSQECTQTNIITFGELNVQN